MAPEILDDILAATDEEHTILDPMCGSGTVVARALFQGRDAIGLDLDPLAVLLTRASASSESPASLEELANKLVRHAKLNPKTPEDLPSVQGCLETQSFIKYWFAANQAGQLAALAASIDDTSQSLILVPICSPRE